MVPATFLAHQVPAFAIARWWPGRVDAVALIVGSAAPDLAYVLTGSRWEIWAHELPGLATFAVPVTLVLSWMIVRVVAPIVPVHLPDLGAFHVHDWRAIASHRFVWWRAPIWAFVGAATHWALDIFTHEWGWFAQNLDWYARPISRWSFVGREWPPYRFVQYGSHVVGVVLAIVMLWQLGRTRRLANQAAAVDVTPSTWRSHLALWTPVTVGLVAGLAWITIDPIGLATTVVRVSVLAFAGLLVGCGLVRYGVR